VQVFARIEWNRIARFPANGTDATDLTGKRDGNQKERGRHERQGEQIYICVENERERGGRRRRKMGTRELFEAAFLVFPCPLFPTNPPPWIEAPVSDHRVVPSSLFRLPSSPHTSAPLVVRAIHLSNLQTELQL